MKTLFFNSLLCASLVAFAVGCGKDNSSGGKKSSGVVASNPYLGTVPAESSAAYSSLRAWYDSTTEGQEPQRTLGNYATYIHKKTKSGTIQECRTKTIDLWIIERDLTYCKLQNSQQNLPDVSVAPVANGGSKHPNALLAQAITGNGLSLIRVTQSGSWFQVVWGKSNGYQVVYFIDTGLNSAFNPYQIIDSEAGSIESLKEIVRPI